MNETQLRDKAELDSEDSTKPADNGVLDDARTAEQEALVRCPNCLGTRCFSYRYCGQFLEMMENGS
jgi:hypothetical protein